MRSSSSRFAPLFAASLGTLLLMGMATAAAQDPITEEEYGPLMSEIRLIVSDAELHIDAAYWPDLGEDLDKLFPMFRRIEAFWDGRGTESAVKLTQDAIAALREIGQAGIAMERGPARAGIANLRAVCSSCHEAHREADGDGFKIKAGS